MRSTLIDVAVTVLGRSPSPQELFAWSEASENGQTLGELVTQLLGTAEGLARFPTVEANTAYLTNAYQVLFGRAPDAEGLAYWLEQLEQNALDRDTLVIVLVEGARAETGNANDAALVNARAQSADAYLTAVEAGEREYDTTAATVAVSGIERADVADPALEPTLPVDEDEDEGDEDNGETPPPVTPPVDESDNGSETPPVNPPTTPPVNPPVTPPVTPPVIPPVTPPVDGGDEEPAPTLPTFQVADNGIQQAVPSESKSVATIDLKDVSFADVESLSVVIAGLNLDIPITVPKNDANDFAQLASSLEVAIGNPGVTVRFNAEANTLTITDEKNRQLSNVELLLQNEKVLAEPTIKEGIPATEFSVNITIELDHMSPKDGAGINLLLGNGDFIFFTFDGEVWSLKGSPFEGSTFKLKVAPHSVVDPNAIAHYGMIDTYNLILTNDKPFLPPTDVFFNYFSDDSGGSYPYSKITPLKDNAQPSNAEVNLKAVNFANVDTLSVTIGEQLFSVTKDSEVDFSALAAALQNKIGDSKVTVLFNKDSLEIIDAAGREISEVKVAGQVEIPLKEAEYTTDTTDGTNWSATFDITDVLDGEDYTYSLTLSEQVEEQTWTGSVDFSELVFIDPGKNVTAISITVDDTVYTATPDSDGFRDESGHELEGIEVNGDELGFIMNVTQTRPFVINGAALKYQDEESVSVAKGAITAVNANFDIFNFSYNVAADELTSVADELVYLINQDERVNSAFTASVNEDGKLVITADNEDTNYHVDLVGVALTNMDDLG